MIREHSPQPHSPSMQYGFVAETTQAGVAMDNLNLFSNEDISKDWEAGEDSGEGSCTVDDEEWDMVNFEAISKISYASSPLVRVGYDYDFVPSIDELGRELVDMTFYSPWLWIEEIADHGDVVRHFRGWLPT